MTAGWERWVGQLWRESQPGLQASVSRPSFPNKALGHLDPRRALYRMGGRQVPSESELSCLDSLHRKLQGVRSRGLSLGPRSLRRKSWALMVFFGFKS